MLVPWYNAINVTNYFIKRLVKSNGSVYTAHLLCLMLVGLFQVITWVQKSSFYSRLFFFSLYYFYLFNIIIIINLMIILFLHIWLVPTLTNAFGVPADLQDFIVSRYLPVIRTHLKPVTLSGKLQTFISRMMQSR